MVKQLEEEGSQQDYAEVIKWYRKAAVQGYAKAQNNLGFMYEEGKGVPQNDTEAVKWYRKAAVQGNAKAQYNLGLIYAAGKDVPQDDVQAYAWIQLAVEGGFEEATSARMLLREEMNSKELEEARKLVRELSEKYPIKKDAN